MIFDVEIKLGGALSGRGCAGPDRISRASRFWRVLERRIEQHRSFRHALGRSEPDQDDQVGHGNLSYLWPQPGDARHFNPRPCKIFPAVVCCSAWALRTRPSPGWHGGVFDRPLKREREYIDIVRKVAAGERTEYEGEIYQTGKRFQLSWKPSYPNVPVYLTAIGSADDQAGRQDFRWRVHQHGNAGQGQRDRLRGCARARSKRGAIPTKLKSSPSRGCRSIPTRAKRGRSCAKC